MEVTAVHMNSYVILDHIEAHLRSVGTNSFLVLFISF